MKWLVIVSLFLAGCASTIRPIEKSIPEPPPSVRPCDVNKNLPCEDANSTDAIVRGFR